MVEILLWGLYFFPVMQEPAADLAIAVAIASSYYEQPVPADMAVVGEIGLAGEIRCGGPPPAIRVQHPQSTI